MLEPRGYDIIGDVHGCVHTLESLLARLGYRQHAGVWGHVRRQALFLGDLLDRGPHIREVLVLVRAMVERGTARAVMGNHEFATLAWHTPLPEGGYALAHTPRHAAMLAATRAQFEGHAAEWAEQLAWCASLPLALDGGHFRVVHACWDADLVQALLQMHPEGRVDTGFVQRAALPGSLEQRISQRLLSGVRLALPPGCEMRGADGVSRKLFRIRFWHSDEAPLTYGDLLFQPDALPRDVHSHPLSDEQKRRLLFYGPDDPLLFVGHYWMTGHPAPVRSNLACLDYSAVNGGKLVAYRLDDEPQLRADKFVWVNCEHGDRPLPHRLDQAGWSGAQPQS